MCSPSCHFQLAARRQSVVVADSTRFAPLRGRRQYDQCLYGVGVLLNTSNARPVAVNDSYSVTEDGVLVAELHAPR